MNIAKKSFSFGILTKSVLLATVLVTFLSGCSSNRKPNRAQIGTISGAAIGGVATAAITRNPLMTIVGTVAGGFIGNSIGNRLDENDREKQARALEAALNSRRKSEMVDWRNGNSGNKGFVRAGRRYKDSSGQLCREFRQKIMIGDSVEEGHGTACLQDDGSWRIRG